MPTPSDRERTRAPLRPGDDGYTLLEMVVVLGILGISVAVSVPTVMPSRSVESRVTAALVKALDSGRAAAARSGGVVTVTINRAGGTVRTAIRLTRTSEDSVLTDAQIPYWAQSSLLSDRGDSLVVAHFNPLGRSAATPMEWTGPDGTHIRLVVNPWTGEASVAQR